MPVITLPNGERANIAEGTPPDVIERIKAANPASRAQRRQAAQTAAPVMSEAQKRAKSYRDIERKANPSMINTINRQVGSGILATFDDELAGAVRAGTKGVYNAVKKGSFGEIGKEYRTERDAQRILQKGDFSDNPVTATVANVGGALINPLGKGDKIVAGAGKVFGKVGAKKLADVAARTSAKIASRGPVASALLAGGNQGALNAAGMAEEDTLGSAASGFGLGAATGGVLGGALKVGTGVAQALKDRGAGNAQTVAYQRIADLLALGGTDAQKAAAELSATNRAGGDAMVADLTPQLGNQAAYLSRNPNISTANKLVERGEARIEGRPARFAQKLSEEARPTTGQDALARMDSLEATRKAAGDRDYAQGGAMDKNFVWNDRLENQFATATPSLKAGLNSAVKTIQDARMDTTSLGIKFDEAGDVNYIKIPSMRVFDEVKRGFDSEIGRALAKGDRGQAKRISDELKLLKDNISQSNPEYADILKTQRDLFQQRDALETGQGVLARMTKEPRVVLRELKRLTPEQTEDARTGIVDALLNLDAKADPVRVFRNAIRNKAQRSIMEFTFGGKAELASFEKWLSREVRAAKVDRKTAFGGQSITGDILTAADAEAPEAARAIFTKGLTGFGFGGAVGATANIARGLDNLRSGIGTLAQEEIAKILLSKGKGLVKGVDKARKFAEKRADNNQRLGVAAGKVAGQAYSPYIAE